MEMDIRVECGVYFIESELNLGVEGWVDWYFVVEFNQGLVKVVVFDDWL